MKFKLTIHVMHFKLTYGGIQMFRLISSMFNCETFQLKIVLVTRFIKKEMDRGKHFNSMELVVMN